MIRPSRAWSRGLVLALLLAAAPVFAQAPGADAGNPDGTNLLNQIGSALQPQQFSTSLTLMIVLTVLSLAPAIIVMTTSFTRIVIVFGFLRQAMATQQSPPNQVLVGLALILTFFIMMPTYQRVYDEAVVPYVNEEMTQTEAWEVGIGPIREFMFRQARPKDIQLFMEIGGYERPKSPDDVPLHVLIPGYVISELRIAFQIGFLLYIPFLIIDMVVASTLMAMGMMMLPPVFISLPFKIILFVLVDGWYLIVGELVRSFR